MVVDDEGDHVTAIKRRWIGPIEMIKNCITGKGMNCQDITAIALSSKVNKTTCKRRIQVKALYGVIQIRKPFNYIEQSSSKGRIECYCP